MVVRRKTASPNQIASRGNREGRSEAPGDADAGLEPASSRASGRSWMAWKVGGSCSESTSSITRRARRCAPMPSAPLMPARESGAPAATMAISALRCGLQRSLAIAWTPRSDVFWLWPSRAGADRTACDRARSRARATYTCPCDSIARVSPAGLAVGTESTASMGFLATASVRTRRKVGPRPPRCRSSAMRRYSATEPVSSPTKRRLGVASPAPSPASLEAPGSCAARHADVTHASVRCSPSLEISKTSAATIASRRYQLAPKALQPKGGSPAEMARSRCGGAVRAGVRAGGCGICASGDRPGLFVSHVPRSDWLRRRVITQHRRDPGRRASPLANNSS